MRRRLGVAAFLAAILAIPSPAHAEDGGDGGTNGDTVDAAIDDASLDAEEPTVIACDGALCATSSGTRCSVTAVGAAGGPADGAAWIAASALAALATSRRSRRARGVGRDALS
jgi:hypothetical protein